MKLVYVLGTTLLSGSMIACHGNEAAKPATVETVSARIVESKQQQVDGLVRATGTVHARQSAIISAQVVGRIQQVLVREGDQVRAGQTVAVLDDAMLRTQVAQAQAGVKAAENQQAAAESGARLAASTLDRYKQLQAQKSVSPQEMDEVSRRAEAAAAQVDAARAQTEAAKAQETGSRTMLEYTRLVAPYSGVVTARMADPGTLASPGVPLMQVDQAGELQLEATVDQSLISQVHKGMKLDVSIDGTNLTSGIVQEIDPAADPASHSFTIKIALPHSNQLHAGMYASAMFANGTRQAVVVPASALVQRGTLMCAYVLDGNGMAQLRYLTLGARHGNLVEVLSGLSASEKLVDAPADRDFAGKRIETTIAEVAQ
jgi:RND family efflux transporter MFP subunit